ncbi:coagulation factor IX [Discoglossus pictus]
MIPVKDFHRMKMACCLSLLLINLLGYFCRAERTVFLSDKSASSVLVREKRYNTGRLEEFVNGNLERECMEETCNYEEAREVFENTEKANEFWNQYIDGDQCLSNPCLNGGQCKDDVSAYTCWCQWGYEGKNCELQLPVVCSIKNGGCQHFCKDNPDKKVVCSCAYGYKLQEDNKSCEPSVPFPCGKVTSKESENSQTRSIWDHESYNVTSMAIQNKTSSENPDEVVPVLALSDDRIVGGTESVKGEFPWQVHLVDKNKKGFCGGTIVNEKWIVTAAHCFIIPGKFSVVAGEHNTETSDGTEQYLNVSRVILHPNYNATKSKYNNDIALIELDNRLTLNNYITPICIGEKEFTEKLLRTRPFSMVTGWGYVRYQGRPATVLQKIMVPFIDRATCKRSSRFTVYPNMFCAGYADQSRDACQGDSGGPHVTSYGNIWFLTGITSWGEKCAEKDKYGVYTRLSRFTDWIQTFTKLP